MLTAEQIKNNWDKFIENICTHLTGERKERLLEFYTKYEERFALMPASSKASYHNAFVGGYADHVNRVLDFSFKVKKQWQENGAIIDFTDEELAMVAINHDLGKFGTEEFENYIDQESAWHREKRGEIYKNNPNNAFMRVQDRSLFTLQRLGIKLTEKEYLSILIHDGLYEDANKSYYTAYSDDTRLRTNLPHIVHQADFMAAKVEGDLVKKYEENKSKAPVIEEPLQVPSPKKDQTPPPQVTVKEKVKEVKAKKQNLVADFFK